MKTVPKALVVTNRNLGLVHDDVHIHGWASLKDLPNIGDFDLIVLDAVDIGNRSDVDWEGFQTGLNQRAFWKVISPGGKVVIIGDPTFIVRTNRVEFPFVWWTGFKFQFDQGSGTQVLPGTSLHADLACAYLKGLRSYSWSILGYEKLEMQTQSYVPGPVPLTLYALAVNRTGVPVAARLSSPRDDGPPLARDKSQQVTANSDHGLWLLPEYQGPDGDGVSVVLRDFFGLHVKTCEPEWVSCTEVPGESEIRDHVVTLKEEINQKEAEVREQEEKLRQLRQPVALLYETGLPLEKAVRNALKSLGGTVTTSSDSGSHDGWVSIEIEGQEHQFVLEVKGYEADSVKEEGIKQLYTWVAEAHAQQDLIPKPVLVVNWARLKPVTERSEAVGENLLKRAKFSNVAVLPSEVLFRTLVKVQKGDLEPSTFWKALLECDGLFSLE